MITSGSILCSWNHVTVFSVCIIYQGHLCYGEMATDLLLYHFFLQNSCKTLAPINHCHFKILTDLKVKSSMNKKKNKFLVDKSFLHWSMTVQHNRITDCMRNQTRVSQCWNCNIEIDMKTSYPSIYKSLAKYRLFGEELCIFLYLLTSRLSWLFLIPLADINNK